MQRRSLRMRHGMAYQIKHYQLKKNMSRLRMLSWLCNQENLPQQSELSMKPRATTSFDLGALPA